MHTGPINQSMICPTYNYSYKDDEWMGAGPSGIEVSDVEADEEGEQGPQGEDSEQEPQEEEGDQGPQMENPTDDDYKVF